MVVSTFEGHFLGEIILAGVTLGQVGVPLCLRHPDLLRGLLVQLHLATVVPREEVVELAGGASLVNTSQLLKRCVHETMEYISHLARSSPNANKIAHSVPLHI